MTNYEVSALKRGLEILDLLNVDRYLTLTEISKSLQINKTTTFRSLKTLKNMNYVKSRDNYYELNREKFQLGHKSKTALDWSTLRSPFLLGKDLQKKIYIGILENMDLVINQIIAPKSEVIENKYTGQRSPPHQSALGKVILANLKEDELNDIVANLSLSKATDQTFIDQDLFLHHLEVIKKQGFAVDYEEQNQGVHCIAAPVFQDNKVIASFAIVSLNERMTKSRLHSLARQITETGKEITKEISSNLHG